MNRNHSADSGIARIKREYIVTHENEPAIKKSKLEDDKNKNTKKRGSNKGRHQKYSSISEPKLCKSVIKSGSELPCANPSCKFGHSIEEYLKLKPDDIGKTCHVYKVNGYCPWGVTCRFLDGHSPVQDSKAIKNEICEEESLTKVIQASLRKKTYDFNKANGAIQSVLGLPIKEKEEEESNTSECITYDTTSEVSIQDATCDTDHNPREKKTIVFKDKLYLSPLTTLGNLPFRRICKEFGADITCGEMAMASNVLQGQSSEWALLRRHPSEDLFGVQLCGNSPYTLGRCAQLVEDAGCADFIDLNLGCPIDIVYQKGSGSGLLRREKNLENVVRSTVLATSLPVTIKTRTGIYDSKKVALNFMPMFTSSGASLITIHGRTREQRYTGPADWSYINDCAKVANPIPVFGNGDVMSYRGYNAALETYTDISGVMIGRGALYKPWIFKEIKEQRDWDISSSERLNILQKFVNYGFEHWGSDSRGVETTRRFLLEWLSFYYRYIPVGILEQPPQRINERPPMYCGRDDLETMMASSNSADWVKISEMLCGPVPDNFRFIPKHKAKSWED